MQYLIMQNASLSLFVILIGEWNIFLVFSSDNDNVMPFRFMESSILRRADNFAYKIVQQNYWDSPEMEKKRHECKTKTFKRFDYVVFLEKMNQT